MKNLTLSVSIVITAILAQSCFNRENNQRTPFADDVEFLRRYAEVIVLSDSSGKSKIAVMAALQGRVMTSTSGSASYGWINRELFGSGDTSEHINAFGGEERFWLGPEGGQYAIFFQPGTEFNLENWHTPRLIDLEPFEIRQRDSRQVSFARSAELTNYSGTRFRIAIGRSVRVLERNEVVDLLGTSLGDSVAVVAYQTVNTLVNAGESPWTRSGGLLSIWLLGMFKPSPAMTVIIPFRTGPEEDLGPVVIDDYFGKVPPDRLKVKDSVIFFRGDGKYRSKIGLTPARAESRLGSYDPETGVLTIVQYNKPDGVADYVNSKWEMQSEPYRGDVVNSYNDGPPAPGEKPLGPFYELETSSPVAELKPGDSLIHIQTTIHFEGDDEAMDRLTTALLGVSVEQIRQAFR